MLFSCMASRFIGQRIMADGTLVFLIHDGMAQITLLHILSPFWFVKYTLYPQRHKAKHQQPTQ